MNELTWSQTLSIQVPEVDADHRKLVDIFNLLKQAVAEAATKEYLDTVMAELVSCTDYHFKHEERLMLKYDYEGYTEHKDEHEDLLKSARELQQKFSRQNEPLLDEDIDFLEHWLTGHILGLDMDLGAFLSKVM